MKKVDIDSNDKDIIKDLLEKNILDRNKNLKIMINFFNNLDGQMVLNLDGQWGTGKTIFLKQLEFINQSDFEFPVSITEQPQTNLLKKFKNKYEIFYFNAWENDLYGSPLESLIFQLLIKLEEVDKDESITRKRLKNIDVLLKKGGLLAGNLVLKSISGGTIGLSDIKLESKDLTKVITTTDEKKKQ